MLLQKYCLALVYLELNEHLMAASRNLKQDTVSLVTYKKEILKTIPKLSHSALSDFFLPSLEVRLVNLYHIFLESIYSGWSRWPYFHSSSQRFTVKIKLKQLTPYQKSIYGLSVAPCLWFQHLLNALLTSKGLIQSKHNPCLLCHRDLIVIWYVVDLGLQVAKKEITDTLIDCLRNKGFEITRERSFTVYLEIQYNQLDDGKISMTQTGLIQKLLQTEIN